MRHGGQKGLAGIRNQLDFSWIGKIKCGIIASKAGKTKVPRPVLVAKSWDDDVLLIHADNALRNSNQHDNLVAVSGHSRVEGAIDLEIRATRLDHFWRDDWIRGRSLQHNVTFTFGTRFGSGIHGRIRGRSWGRIVFATNDVDVGPDRSVAAAAGSSGVVIISALRTCPGENAAGII